MAKTLEVVRPREEAVQHNLRRLRKLSGVVALLVFGAVFLWFGRGSTPQNGMWEFSIVGDGLLVFGILLAALYLMSFAGHRRT